MSADPLSAVRRAARVRARADARLQAAIVAAVDAGCTYAEVARALGVSRQAVRQMLTRSP